jgi:hypothetical protein
MTAGLIQLVSKSIEDYYLTGDPQITFFKLVYRRHTNFAIESICQHFNSTPNFGESVVCKLTRSGDLVGRMILYVETSIIPKMNNSISKFAWARNLGHVLISEVSIVIGNNVIDKQYGEWLHIWSELSCHNIHALNKMIGNYPEVYDFDSEKKSFKLFIPLQFWFCKNNGLFLPLIALSSEEIKIHVVFRKAEECYCLGPTHSIEVLENIIPFKPGDYIVQKINNQRIYGYVIHYDFLNKRLYYIKISNDAFTSFSVVNENSRFLEKIIIPDKLLQDENFIENIPYRIYSVTNDLYCTPKPNSMERIEIVDFSIPYIFKSFLYVDFVYLDDEERKKFINNNQEYLIEQIQFNQQVNISSTFASQRLTLKNICKSHYFVSQLNIMKGPMRDHFNYTTSPVYIDNNYYGKSLIDKAVLKINGVERFSERDYDYFNFIEPLEHHKRGPKIGINVYSFSLYPENHQPSSVINMDRINSAFFDIKLNSTVTENNRASIRSYTLSYNIWRVCSGMSGLVFQ